MYPDEWQWGLKEQLLASLLDVQRWIQWTKTEAAQKKDPPPDPIPRPGIKPPEAIGAGAAIPIDELEAELGWG